MVSGEPRRTRGGRLKIFGSRIDAITAEGALDQILRFLMSLEPHHVTTGNTLMLLEAEKDTQLRQILEDAALVVPESSGISWASRILGSPLAEFVPGIDLMLDVCRLVAFANTSSPKSVFLLGSQLGVAEE